MPHKDPVKRREWQAAYTARTADRKRGYNKQYGQDRRAEISAQNAEYYQRNRDKILEARKKYQTEHADRIKASKGKRYKLRKPRQEMVAGRPCPDVCEICGRGGIICFDHCHASGEFRGWLCRACNSTLGLMEDNPDYIRRLAAYLEIRSDWPGV